MERSPEEAMLGKVWRSSRPQRARPICFSENCSARAAKNHLLMQNGILNEIVDGSRHVRELRTNRFRSEGDYYSFERVGWDDALTMYGYCPSCDNKLFSPIEGVMPRIPDSLASSCRYGLRPVLHEILKKEGNLKFFAKQPVEKIRQFDLDSGVSPELSTRLSIAMLKNVYLLLMQGVKGVSQTLIYGVRRVERRELCASAAWISPRLMFTTETDEILAERRYLDGCAFNVINIFPCADELVIVSVANTAEAASVRFFHQLMDCIGVELDAVLSNLLVAQIEDWAVSERFFSRFPPDLLGVINRAKDRYSDFHVDHSFRLFSF